MLVEQEARTVREAVGVFNRSEDLQDTIDELLSSGFDRAELSLLASEHAVEEKLGHQYEKVGALADDPTVPRAAYVSTEAIGGAEGGLIGGLMYVGAAAAAGAIVVSGGTLDAHYLQEQMDRGGLLLWVRTWDAEGERRAVEILRKHSGGHVHVHALPAA
jgi:hypothetical protein